MEASTIRQNGMFFCRTAACVLLFLALSLTPVFAADDEIDIFTKGYEYLFSFKPDKAAETFRVFLREFPHSSARDAAQFWLGKTLIALGSYTEAEQLFLDTKREFPESPFLSFIDNELAEIAKARSSGTGKERINFATTAENIQSGSERSAAEKDRQTAQITDERNRPVIDSGRRSELPANADQKQHTRDSLLLKISELQDQVWQKEAALSEATKVQEDSRREVEAERKKADALRADIARLSQIEIIFKELWRSYEEVISDSEQHSSLTREEMAKDEAQQSEAADALLQIKEQSTAAAQPSLPHQDGQPSIQPVSAQDEFLLIRGKVYTLPQIIHAVLASERAIEKLGIREPIWRTGNPLDDFINEQLLSEDAAMSGAMPDEERYQETANHYDLIAGEADYLRKLMIIGSFIEKTYRNIAPERFIEILTVSYQDDSSAQKMVTAAELQNAAKSGMSFVEIEKAHYESVRFSRLRVDEFTSRYKDKSQIIGKLNFLTEETAVMWSEKGYMLIKPITNRKQFDLFAGFPIEEEDKIRSFLSGYIAELRKNM